MDPIPVTRLASLTILLALTAPAAAEEPAPPPPTEEKVADAPKPESEETRAANARMQALERKLAALEDELAAQKDDSSYLEEKLSQLLPLTGKLGGYLDVGAFATSGNGAGT